MRQNTDNVHKRQDAKRRLCRNSGRQTGKEEEGPTCLFCLPSLTNYKRFQHVPPPPTTPPPPRPPVHRNRSDLAHLIKHAHI